MEDKFELDGLNGDIVVCHKDLKILAEILETCKSRYCDDPTDLLWEKVDEVLTEINGEIDGQDLAIKARNDSKPQLRQCAVCCQQRVHRPDDERGLVCTICETPPFWWNRDYQFEIRELVKTL